MSAFAMHFFICSLWISVITGLLLGAKYMLRRHLSCRMQYAFRLPFFLLLAMPFFSFRPANPIGLLPILELWKQKTAAGITSPFPTSPIESGLNTSHWMNNFAVSSGHPTASFFPSLFLFVWIAGMFVMLFFVIKARIRLYRLECSALPLQNKDSPPALQAMPGGDEHPQGYPCLQFRLLPFTYLRGLIPPQNLFARSHALRLRHEIHPLYAAARTAALQA